MPGPSRRLFFSAAMLFLLLGIAVPVASHPVSASTPGTGVIVPLYAYPSSAWNAIIQAKDAHPSVPIVAIVDPDDGPGAKVDPNYVSAIDSLRAAGVIIIGYVWTDYASRSVGSIEADIGAYKSWYGVAGIFFDQMPNAAGHESYYSSLNQYAHSLGLALTVGNPGMQIPASYIGTLDCIVVYENSGAPTLATISTITMGASKSNFAMIGYGVNSFTASYVSEISGYVNYLYLTNGAPPLPYSSLSSYFAALVAALVPIQNVPVTVQSETAGGSSLSGMWTVVKHDGAIVASGYTPFTFYGTPGAQYAISVANYGTYYFSKWDDQSTNPARVVTVSQATTLTAFYSVPNDFINVQSISVSGAAVKGMWTVVKHDGAIVASGYTPFTFYGTPGAQYTVTVSSFGPYTFSHWDNWATSRSRTLTLNQDLWLTAVYSS